MGYKRVKNSQKKIWEGRTHTDSLKTFYPRHPFCRSLIFNKLPIKYN